MPVKAHQQLLCHRPPCKMNALKLLFLLFLQAWLNSSGSIKHTCRHLRLTGENTNSVYGLESPVPASKECCVSAKYSLAYFRPVGKLAGTTGHSPVTLTDVDRVRPSANPLHRFVNPCLQSRSPTCSPACALCGSRGMAQWSTCGG